MKYSYKLISLYIKGVLKKEKLIESLDILGLNPEIVFSKKDDVVFFLEIPANRGDLLSLTGVAKELLPFFDFQVVFPDIEFHENIEDKREIKIENSEDCPYYSCRVIRNVKNSDSSSLKDYMEKLGFRSSSDLVDISNFIMAETGQPIHIFDLDKIEGNIEVRRAVNGEDITTIDGKNRKLNSDILVIADSRKPIAIAGIMGGANSEVTADTKNILIESAEFAPLMARQGSKIMGLVTEASLRFEKGMAFETIKRGMDRTTDMVGKICGGDIGKLSYAGDKSEMEKNIELKKQKVSDILGISVKEEFLENLFSRENFKYQKRDNSYFIIPPSSRKDLKEDVDIIEEVARYKKYSEIPSEMPSACIIPTKSLPDIKKIEKIKNIFLNMGFSEVINLSLISREIVEKYNFDAVRLENALSENFGYLRTSLLPGILDSIKLNISHETRELEIFEAGKIYFKQGKSFREGYCVACSSVDSGDFFSLKGKIEKFIEKCGYKVNYKLEKGSVFSDNNTCLGIYFKNKRIGDIFIPSPEVKKNYQLEDSEVYLAELYMEDLLNEITFLKNFTELPRYPAVKRDFSFIFPADVQWKKVENIVISVENVESIEVFDIYKGKNIPADKISVSFTVIFRSSEKTLENEEIDICAASIIEAVKLQTKGELRGESSES
jgi:phenylalanyl-tRNA synthetase beta chain